jgi:hypothetical protein
MFGSVVFFLYGHFSQNPAYMDQATQWGLIGAAVTVVFGLIRRLRTPSHSQEEKKAGGP